MGPETLVIWVLLLIAVMYFLMVRPQQKRVQAHRELVESLDVGDEVVTIGGIRGSISGIDDEVINIQIAENTNVRFSRSAVAAKTSDDEDNDTDDEVESIEETATTADKGA